jgi:hypothetical protein
MIDCRFGSTTMTGPPVRAAPWPSVCGLMFRCCNAARLVLSWVVWRVMTSPRPCWLAMSAIWSAALPAK